ncbi:hypothetical protein QK910_08815 [Lactococcus cremoris]|uniref:hypothetical protein n=1 Tax=Lactococcus lactis subsp. cremoris TaxID=1359 RepID=UPI003A806335
MINATFLKIIMSIVLVLAYLLSAFNQYMNRKKNKNFCKNIAKQTFLVVVTALVIWALPELFKLFL